MAQNFAALRRGPAAKPILFFAFATVIFLAALVLSPARSQSQAASTPLKPELQPLSYFVGQWNCSGEFIASKKPISSRFVFSPALEGSWLAFRWDDNAPNAFHALELWGFDKTMRHFTNSIYDSSGGMRVLNSTGWAGDTLTWSHDLPPNSRFTSERFVFDRKSTKEFVISWEVLKTQAQQWTVGDRLACQQE